MAWHVLKCLCTYRCSRPASAIVAHSNVHDDIQSSSLRREQPFHSYSFRSDDSMAGGRKAKPAQPARPTNTLIVDNGAYTLKAGLVAGGQIGEPRIIPNCIARDRSRKVYLGTDLAKCRDYGELQFRRPVERGFIVNWEAQKEIWDQELFENNATKCDPAETRLILAEPPNGLPVLQTNCDQVVFEEYGFASYYRGVGKRCTPQAVDGHYSRC